jgi:inorganic phosphate transporter, PiT family
MVARWGRADVRGFDLAVLMALAFAVTNGLHDAANAIATLIATRAGRPLPAALLAATCNMIGPLLLGAAVANTIATIVLVPPSQEIAVIGAGLTGAVAWNVVTWLRGLPASSSHALVGGLVGAALVAAGPSAVNWGGFDGWRPVGVWGVLIALAVSPLLGFWAAAGLTRLSLRPLGRATTRVLGPIRKGQWATSAWLGLSHGSNDAQKTVGVVAALLLAHGSIDSLAAPVWVTLVCGAALTLGTALGGWPIVRTIGSRITRLRPLDGLTSSTGSAAVILFSSVVGAPASTTQVVSSAVVGTGFGRHRAGHVHWDIVRKILTAWITTFPAAAVIAAVSYPIWRWLA